MSVIRVYTDGACSGNPGPGGWAAVFCIGNGTKELKGYELETTNNRMELEAVIRVFERILSNASGNNSFHIYTDSKYVLLATDNEKIRQWRNKAWCGTNGKPLKNQDLLVRLGDLKERLKLHGHNVVMLKVKGHDGDPMNELADKIAVKQSKIAKEELGGWV